MASKTRKIDGDLSLDDLKKRCQVEQGAVFQLSSIKGDTETVGTTVFLINVAKFTLKDDDILKKLKFVDVKGKSATDIDKIKADMKGEGQTLLCDVSDIVASKNATKVMVFGKK